MSASFCLVFTFFKIIWFQFSLGLRRMTSSSSKKINTCLYFVQFFICYKISPLVGMSWNYLLVGVLSLFLYIFQFLCIYIVDFPWMNMIFSKGHLSQQFSTTCSSVKNEAAWMESAQIHECDIMRGEMHVKSTYFVWETKNLHLSKQWITTTRIR